GPTLRFARLRRTRGAPIQCALGLRHSVRAVRGHDRRRWRCRVQRSRRASVGPSSSSLPRPTAKTTLGVPSATRECSGLALPPATRNDEKSFGVREWSAWTDTWLDTLTGVVQAVQPRRRMSGWSSVDTAWTRRSVQAANVRRSEHFFERRRNAWTRAA